jgi:hypothetical protein
VQRFLSSYIFLTDQPSIQSGMSQTATTSSATYEIIVNDAIEAYKKKTKKDLRSHPLLNKLQTCDSPDAVLSVLYEQIPGFDQSCGTDDKLTKWLNPTVNVLCTFSGVIAGGIGLASPKRAQGFKFVSDLMFDWRTGITTSRSGLHRNWRPSISESFFFIQFIPGLRLILIPNSPRRLRPFPMARTCLLRSSGE